MERSRRKKTLKFAVLISRGREGKTLSHFFSCVSTPSSTSVYLNSSREGKRVREARKKFCVAANFIFAFASSCKYTIIFLRYFLCSLPPFRFPALFFQVISRSRRRHRPQQTSEFLIICERQVLTLRSYLGNFWAFLS